MPTPTSESGRHAPERTSGRRANLPVVALRGVQFALDLALTTLLCLVPMSVTLLLPRNPDDTLGRLLISIPVILLAMLACVVVSWWYWAWRPSRHGGRTFAMGWLRLRVIRSDGAEVGATLLALRWIMLLVDGLFFGLVGLVVMLATPHGQRLGDVVADTLVVSTMPDRTGPDPRALDLPEADGAGPSVRR